MLRTISTKALLLGLLGAFLLSPFGTAGPAFAQDTVRELTQVAGNVWRFQNNFHYALVVDTSDGVVVVDPISADAARWLEAEIASRFDRPVTHLIYSHSHGDHASGGTVLADTATVIAQENAPDQMDGVAPDIRFSERLNFRSGGHRFELTYLGPGHGTDLLALVVRPENVAFIVDAVSPGRLPYRDFPGADIAGLIEQIERVEGLDFQILAPGHSRLGEKADATAAREYIEWLRGAVAAELKAGKGIDEVVETLDTSAYADLGAYERWRDLNVQGMARWLQESGEVD
ncbi:MAG: MBL fold metallo-hydrolase [Paracoccaceae bacterium]|nr:MBL fold metallo-hydrolase [Paracoccaceae bacterium]